MQIALSGMLLSPTVHFDRDLARQLAAQVLHVHPGSAVDERRELPREKSYSQSLLLRIS
jgi:hypothetical protein